ncbi:hypothetical protein ABW20_dc0107690 [Dactylellina cionopaga]|nr:hypothetical protein ABW20_dc0107690 [Dactylellina cionopaga]
MKASLCFTVTSVLFTSLANFGLAEETPGGTPNKPEHTEPDEAANCDYWYIADVAETCSTLNQKTGLSLDALRNLNPSLRADCSSLKPGWGYCIYAREERTTTASTSNAPSTSLAVTTTESSSVPVLITTTTTFATSTRQISTTVIAGASGTATPSPIQPGVVNNCAGWTYVQPTDTCATIVTKYGSTGLTFEKLVEWNSALLSDCSGLLPGYFICVQLAATPTTSKISTKVSTTSISKISTTPNITTKSPPPPPPVPTFTPEQFSPKKGQSIRCVTATPGKPAPPSNYAGPGLARAIREACGKILPGGSKFLEKGLPYSTTASQGGNEDGFYLKIWLGGFKVPNDLCIQHMTAILQGCRSGEPARTFGGCSYSSDLNFQACIFP